MQKPFAEYNLESSNFLYLIHSCMLDSDIVSSNPVEHISASFLQSGH